MTQQYEQKQPQQQAAASGSPRLSERVLAAVGSVASTYVSIVAGLILFTVNRIGRLTLREVKP